MKVVPLLLATMILAFAGAAAAQAPASALELESSTRLSSCVKTGEAPPKYPPGMVERKLGGIVRVRLTFVAANEPPRTEVFYATVGHVFRDAVLDHVDSYRLPCLRPDDPPAVMTQECAFSPVVSAKVFWYPLRNEPDAARRNLASCPTGADNLPAYPYGRGDAVENGSVLARFTFTKIRSAAGGRDSLRRGQPSIRSIRRRLRNASAFAVSAGDRFATQGDPAFQLRHGGESSQHTEELDARGVRAAVDNIENEHVRFDFRTMGCPFDVRFQLRQPVLPNAVGEVERSDPNRREFLEWLRGVKLKLSAEQRRTVIGDSMTISVPCGELDLAEFTLTDPQEDP